MKKYIVANWKSQKNLSQVRAWFDQFPRGKEAKALLAMFEVVVAVPYPLLWFAQESIENRQLALRLAVQDLSAFGPGAFTGEVCPENLEDLAVDFALLGHSERRRYLKETSQLVADKCLEARRAQIQPILCIDTPYAEEQQQLLTNDSLASAIIAYEPQAAIGSGLAENPTDFFQVKKQLSQLFPRRPILYGGSVNAGNIAEYLRLGDGVLVGTASLDVRDFIDMLYAARQIQED